MKILVTNWINIIGLFGILFLYTFFNSWINSPATFIEALFGAFLLICLYGVLFWTWFCVLLLLTDLILIIPNQKYLRVKLTIQWIIISSFPIYWAIKYKEQQSIYVLFSIAIITFLITQLIREKYIIKALN